MNIINLTPHDITVVNTKDNTKKVIPRSGKIARCEQIEDLTGNVDGIKLYKTNMGKVIDLPERSKDTLYIVSMIVAQAVKNKRDDVIIPFGLVRDEKGVIIGCQGFARIKD